MDFWIAPFMRDPLLIENARPKSAMGHMGRLQLWKIFGQTTIISYFKKALDLTDRGIKVPGESKFAEKKELVVPGYFWEALKNQ